MRSCVAVVEGRPVDLGARALPLDLDLLVPGDGPWEVEIGFGKGRYLLRRALEESERRFLGLEVAGKYHGLLAKRAARRGAGNLAVVKAEALRALSTVLPVGFAEAVHVYFPDPWPKSRHQRRRLFDPETVDLVVDLLAPGGLLFFATDFQEYGDVVEEILRGHPALRVERRDSAWPDGARTNYEAKYEVEGRPIRRLTAELVADRPPPRLHPRGSLGVVAAYAPTRGSGEEDGWAS